MKTSKNAFRQKVRKYSINIDDTDSFFLKEPYIHIHELIDVNFKIIINSYKVINTKSGLNILIKGYKIINIMFVTNKPSRELSSTKSFVEFVKIMPFSEIGEIADVSVEILHAQISTFDDKWVNISSIYSLSANVITTYYFNENINNWKKGINSDSFAIISNSPSCKNHYKC